MPIVATTHTPAGAKAFAEFFMLTRDWGYATMSGAYLRHYSAPTCVSCSALATAQDTARKKGHRYIGGRTTVVGSRPRIGHVVEPQMVTINTTSFEEVDAKGDFVTGDPAYKKQEWQLSLGWIGGRWLVTSLAIVL